MPPLYLSTLFVPFVRRSTTFLRSARGIRVMMFMLCLVLAVAAYANTLPNPFIWDDEGLIVTNALIQSPDGWRRIFSADLFAGTFAGSNFYRPLQSLSFILDFRIWHLNPTGYHLTNIALHAAVIFLLFLFLAEVSRNVAVSAAAAVLYGVHPLHTEVVAYVSGRADMLMAIALLSSFLFYSAAERAAGARPRAVLYAASLAAFCAGLLSKELAAVFPFALLARAVYRRPGGAGGGGRAALRISPFFVLTLAYVLLRFTVLHFTTQWMPELTQYSFALRFMMLPKVLASYVQILFYPVDLHMSRTLVRPLSPAGIAWDCVLSVSIVCAAIAVLRRFRRRSAAAGFLCAWGLIFFLPQSGLFPINAFVAEHFIHLASAGVFFAAAHVMRRYLRPAGFWTAVAGLAVLLTVLTVTRNFEWRDPVVFYRGIIRHSPDSYLAHNNLGVQYDRRGRYEEAVAEFKAALRIKPLRIEAYSNLADAYFKMRRYDESLEAYRTVEQLVPAGRAGEIQNNIGNVYLAMERYPQALARYDLALRLDGSLFYVHYNRARALRALGRGGEAAEAVLESLRGALPPDSAESGRLRAVVHDFISGGEPPECPIQFYTRLGMRSSEAGLAETAVVCMRRALAISALSADARFNLGLALMKKGETGEAVRELREALRIDPGHVRARAVLAGLDTKSPGGR